MICTLYAHQLGFDKIVQILKSNIPKGQFNFSELDGFNIVEIKTKGSFFSSDIKLKVSYRERIQPSYQISEKEDCPFNENLKGLYGFVTSLPSNNEKIKSLFLHKIQTLNSECSIFQEKGTTKNLGDIIFKLANAFDAIIFAQPNTVISKSENQHFLDKNLDLIIDPNGNCEIDELSVSIDAKYYDTNSIEITEDQKSRKTESEIILKKHNVKINNNLPYIESENDITIRTAKEIAERVTVLTITNLVAFSNISGEEAIDMLNKFNLMDLVTPNEKSFLENPTDQQKSQETWKCEGIWTLMWALKIVDDLGFPNEMADLNNIPLKKYPIGKDKDPNDFINAQKTVRTKSDLLNVNDLYYRLDWACVDARLNNRQITEVNSGVVYERHYALNWLINYMNADWDDVTCDT
ncbi:DUF4272 domain-containing protein [Winogradskyella forsetii]|uniref:DUF4272 domain-containing protein n=1 Tax=Winogradskyella forsetii TaxID=2686077 RepID=UPI0015B98808|nr:DUF4272 domain-containing protein [Winogradskyella forsetii]